MKLRLTPTRLIALGFLLTILVGALLLLLPISSKLPSVSFTEALFTATSATCVTGLTRFDTWSQFNGFGQVVVICLIQIGGLGFMMVASLVSLLAGRRIGLYERSLLMESIGALNVGGIIRLCRRALIGTAIFEGIGAALLSLWFCPRFGMGQGLWMSVFHSVSAFCNAGFDLMGIRAPGTSLMLAADSVLVNIVVMLLVLIGGLGFFVWEEVVRLHSWKKFSVYTKLVLLSSLVLLVGGAALIALLEWNNPGTLGTMSTPQKIMNAFFQSVTVRTAGFVSIDQALLTDAGKGVSMVLMLIGGSSGSTAGGVKTVTMVVLVLFLWARARGRSTVTVFKRTIPGDKALDAMTIVGLVTGLAVLGAVFVSATSPIGFTDSLYECISAIATVGLTSGVTGLLSLPAQLLITVFMYFGRVGILTISLGFLMGDRAEERFRYAQTNLLIG